MSVHFLRCPQDIDASAYYYKRGSTAGKLTLNISNIAAAFFSPGHQYDPHTAVVKTDGSIAHLYYQADAESRGNSPGAHLHHRHLVSLIESRTGQRLIEVVEDKEKSGTSISNINPALALGFLNKVSVGSKRVAVCVKGLSNPCEVTKDDASELIMSAIRDALPLTKTISFTQHNRDSELVYDPLAVRAVWQNFDNVFLWLDGMKAPTTLYFDTEEADTANHILESVVASSGGKLLGSRLGEGASATMAFFAQPEDIGSIEVEGNHIKVLFGTAANLMTESYREPNFYLKKNATREAERLLLAFSPTP